MHKNKSNETEASELGLKFVASDSKYFLSAMEKILHYEKDIVYCLEMLGSARLVEKISRPTEMIAKLQEIQSFKTILEEVHAKMSTMENEIDLSYFNYENKKESFVLGDGKENRRESFTVQKEIKMEKKKKIFELIINVKLSYFNIRKKYIEVLIQSGLSRFNRVASVLQIEEKLDFLDVDIWLSNCIKKMEKTNEKSTNVCC